VRAKLQPGFRQLIVERIVLVAHRSAEADSARTTGQTRSDRTLEYGGANTESAIGRGACEGEQRQEGRLIRGGRGERSRKPGQK
jgi:hypothetical protein